jgi:hypothetical protein
MGNCCCIDPEAVTDECAILVGTWSSSQLSITIHAGGQIDLTGFGNTTTNWPCRGWAKLDDTIEFETLALCICCCCLGRSEYKCVMHGDTMDVQFDGHTANGLTKA